MYENGTQQIALTDYAVEVSSTFDPSSPNNSIRIDVVNNINRYYEDVLGDKYLMKASQGVQSIQGNITFQEKATFNSGINTFDVNTSSIVSGNITVQSTLDSTRINVGNLNISGNLNTESGTTVDFGGDAIFRNRISVSGVIESGSEISGDSFRANGSATSTIYPDGTIGNDKVKRNSIEDGAVTENKIDNYAVTREKIADNSIDTDHIRGYSITRIKMAENSVSTSNIVNTSVTGEKIRSRTITSGLIAQGGVTDYELAPDSVTNSKILNNQITINKMQSNSVGTSQLVGGSVTESKLSTSLLSSAVYGVPYDSTLGKYAMFENAYKNFHSASENSPNIRVIGTPNTYVKLRVIRWYANGLDKGNPSDPSVPKLIGAEGNVVFNDYGLPSSDGSKHMCVLQLEITNSGGSPLQVMDRTAISYTG